MTMTALERDIWEAVRAGATVAECVQRFAGRGDTLSRQDLARTAMVFHKLGYVNRYDDAGAPQTPSRTIESAFEHHELSEKRQFAAFSDGGREWYQQHRWIEGRPARA